MKLWVSMYVDPKTKLEERLRTAERQYSMLNQQNIALRKENEKLRNAVIEIATAGGHPEPEKLLSLLLEK